MKAKNRMLLFLVVVAISGGCKKGGGNDAPAPGFTFLSLTIDGKNNGFEYNGTSLSPVLKFTFSDAVKQSSINEGLVFSQNATAIAYKASLENSNKTIVIQPSAPLTDFTTYTVTVNDKLLSEPGSTANNRPTVTLNTGLDSTDKFPRITDDDLLTLVEKQTFNYFYGFAHPVSGLARERNTSGDVVTTGGSGFGIMALVTGVERSFITRAEGLAQMQKIVGFLKGTAQSFHGAFPHWMNGATGAVVPFSEKDDGADLVETSYLMQGLLTARQYFDGGGLAETTLRNDINSLWEAVEWSWFRQNGQDVLYWHWSSDFDWAMNVKISGWNECLITYVMAASSPGFSIPKSVYDNGWAHGGEIRNNNTYYGVTLPLGPPQGGPLFFAHYSFLGINPTGLSDAYANYWQQNVAHATINYKYCVANPKGYYGYSSSVWGLTASDEENGYSAHAPDNDDGVISPTAALSSFPYTPVQSMAALKFFYYKLGNRIWTNEYGFVDAFNLSTKWFADSYLAIDQGPIIVMIENYRTGLLWNLFMSCPEVKTGMTNLGFQSPDL